MASLQPGHAETCLETFTRLLVDGNGDTPVKIHAVQEIKGGMTSSNDFLQVETGHWMTRTIEPTNQPWVLTYNNTMYTSADKGATWTKLRTVDSAENRKNALKNQRENAATARKAVCGTEDLDGAAHDVVEAEFDTLQNFKATNHYKYWVNSQTGWISKTTYKMTGQGFESFTTQTLEPAPGLTLPTPK